MATARFAHASVACGRSIYVLGGWLRTGPRETTAACEAYDAATNAWVALPPMSTARARHSATAVGTSIYVFGGFNSHEGDAGALASGECFDTGPNPQATAWRPTAPMPVPHRGHRALGWDGGSIHPSNGGVRLAEAGAPADPSVFPSVFVFGGVAGVLDPRAVWQYRVGANVWRIAEWHVPFDDRFGDLAAYIVYGCVVLWQGGGPIWRLVDAAKDQWAEVAAAGLP